MRPAGVLAEQFENCAAHKAQTLTAFRRSGLDVCFQPDSSPV